MSRVGTAVEVIDVEQFLSGLTSAPAFFIPNPGNAGDSLIAVATFQLFRKIGLDFRAIPADAFDSSDKVVIYGGGGNLVPAYSNAREFISRHHRTARRLIVLPHSVAGNEDLLASLGPNVTIICRELISFEHVRRHAARAEVLLAHDLVLNLDLKAALAPQPGLAANAAGKISLYLRGRGEGSRYLVSPKYFWRDWLFLTKVDINRLVQHRKGLCAFRTDVERHGTLPAHNYDLSRQFMYGCYSERLASYASARLLSVIDRFSEIETNRLHVCIAAALLGKDVRFYANSYYKCRAVFEFSLADRFKKVKWIGDR